MSFTSHSMTDVLNVLEDLEKLSNLRITSNQGHAGGHLGKDATDTPDIHTGRIVSATQQHLGWPVPESDDLSRTQ